MSGEVGVLLLLLAGCTPVSGCGQKAESVKSTDETDSESAVDTGTENESNDPPLFDGCPAEPPANSCTDGWCRIEPGTFVLGSPVTESPSCRGKYNEKQVQVTLTRPFKIQRHEVIQAQWEAMGFPNPSRDVHPQKPVTWINWFEAAAYCNALSVAQGLEPCYDLSGCNGEVGSGCPDEGWFYENGCSFLQGLDVFVPGLFYCFGEVHRYENWYECPGYRLPTLAEREYATRACISTATYNGDITTTTSGGTCDVDQVAEPIAWYCGNSGGELKTVCTKEPNAWHLCDMLGNAREFIDYQFTGLSLEHGEGTAGPLTDPIGDRTVYENGMPTRVLVSGSYRTDACHVRAADQLGHYFAERVDDYGFRPVRTL
jgi:formylglycine-generating enzyme required for sulfatase activity